MTLMPEIHDALAHAVATRPAQRRWRHPSRRTGLLAAGAFLATGSALAATGAWHPTLGDDQRGHPQAASIAVPSQQAAALGVLRRAQTASDRGTDVQVVLRLFPRVEINGVHTNAIRVLRRRTNFVAMLVPAERVGTHDSGHASSIQRNVLCLLTGVTIKPPTATVSDHNGHTQTIHTPSGPSAGQVCGDLRQLRTTGIGGATRTDTGWISGALVPDGVASVVIRLRHHRRATARVHYNYYAINTGSELAPARGTYWLDAQGHTIDHRRATQP